MEFRNKYDTFLFHGIKSEDLSAMLNCLKAKEVNFKKGEFINIIFGETVGVVVSGVVSMISQDAWGNESLLTKIHVGELLGETFACAEQRNDMVSFRAHNDCVVLMMDYHKVLYNCNLSCVFHHKLVENMLTMIAEKNYSLMKKANVVSKRTLREKVLTYLSYEKSENQSDKFEIQFNRTEFANYLAADRTALARELKKMQDENIIKCNKNSFEILLTSAL